MFEIPVSRAGVVFFDAESKLQFCIHCGVSGIEDMVNRTRFKLLSHSARLLDTEYVKSASGAERRIAFADRGLTIVFVIDFTALSNSVCVEGLGIRGNKVMKREPPLCEAEFLFVLDALDEIWTQNDRILALVMSAHGGNSPLACLKLDLLRKIVDLVTVPVHEMEFYKMNLKKLARQRAMDQYDYSADSSDDGSE